MTAKRRLIREDSPSGGKTSDAALSTAETPFRAVADYTYDWESWHGPDGDLRWVNPAVHRVTGYSPSECLTIDGYPLPLVVADDRERIRDVLTSAQRRASGENVEFRCLHRDGSTRWMSLSWQPMFGDAGSYLGFRTSIREITEVKKLREQVRLYVEHLEQLVQERTLSLRQLEQRQAQMEKLAALGQLAAGVAHEINNPLAGMRNAFELIKSELSPESAHYELLDLIDREFDRISGIIHQMYQLYRRGPQQPAVFMMSRIVGEVAYLLETVSKKRKVSLHCPPPAAPVEVLLVEGEVKQVLYNVIRNAIQASPPSSEVRVEIRQANEEVLVMVTDQGDGIAPDVLPRIFDPFFSTKQGEAQSGMGLGLSVSRSLMEAMGGRIDVQTTVGRGSRFTLAFPRRVAPQESDDE